MSLEDDFFTIPNKTGVKIKCMFSNHWCILCGKALQSSPLFQCTRCEINIHRDCLSIEIQKIVDSFTACIPCITESIVGIDMIRSWNNRTRVITRKKHQMFCIKQNILFGQIVTMQPNNNNNNKSMECKVVYTGMICPLYDGHAFFKTSAFCPCYVSILVPEEVDIDHNILENYFLYYTTRKWYYAIRLPDEKKFLEMPPAFLKILYPVYLRRRQLADTNTIIRESIVNNSKRVSLPLPALPDILFYRKVISKNRKDNSIEFDCRKISSSLANVTKLSIQSRQKTRNSRLKMSTPKITLAPQKLATTKKVAAPIEEDVYEEVYEEVYEDEEEEEVGSMPNLLSNKNGKAPAKVNENAEPSKMHHEEKVVKPKVVIVDEEDEEQPKVESTQKKNVQPPKNSVKAKANNKEEVKNTIKPKAIPRIIVEDEMQKNKPPQKLKQQRRESDNDDEEEVKMKAPVIPRQVVHFVEEEAEDDERDDDEIEKEVGMEEEGDGDSIYSESDPRMDEDDPNLVVPDDHIEMMEDHEQGGMVTKKRSTRATGPVKGKFVDFDQVNMDSAEKLGKESGKKNPPTSKMTDADKKRKRAETSAPEKRRKPTPPESDVKKGKHLSDTDKKVEMNGHLISSFTLKVDKLKKCEKAGSPLPPDVDPLAKGRLTEDAYNEKIGRLLATLALYTPDEIRKKMHQDVNIPFNNIFKEDPEGVQEAFQTDLAKDYLRLVYRYLHKYSPHLPHHIAAAKSQKKLVVETDF